MLYNEENDVSDLEYTTDGTVIYANVPDDEGTLCNAYYIDLRSDTLTRPTLNMRQAMFEAKVGDDVFDEDPTVNELQKTVATLLGKEAALFVPSGTMSNLIAIMNHCDTRGSEAYCGEEAHVILHEQGGAAQIGGVTLRTLPNNRDGTFSLETLESKIRKRNIHEPISKLILVENTINGKIIPQSWIDDLALLAKKYNLKLHMDGARVWNASVATNIAVDDIVSKFDSVSVCLSKGLGAPIGSLLCGTKDFISKAKRLRKVLGGGTRQAGILAAAGLVALNDIFHLLKDDHRRAFLIAKAINNLNSKVFNVDLLTVQTNMVFVNICSEHITSLDFVQRLKDIKSTEEKVIVKGMSIGIKSVRFVLYHEISDKMVELAIYKIILVIKELDPEVSE